MASDPSLKLGSDCRSLLALDRIQRKLPHTLAQKAAGCQSLLGWKAEMLTTMSDPPAALKVVAFDLFGTVVDWRGGVMAELADVARERSLTVDAGAVADDWRRRVRALLDNIARGSAPYRVLDELHRAALDELAGKYSMERLSDQDRDRLVRAWHRLSAWPDAVEGLNRLRAGYVLTTLSNGGLAHQVDVVRFAKLPFDCLLSTEMVQSYKPDRRTYQLVPSYLRVAPEQAMMVASHPYDLKAAAAQGFRTAFVSRPQEWGTGKPEKRDFKVDVAASDFLDLADQLGA